MCMCVFVDYKYMIKYVHIDIGLIIMYKYVYFDIRIMLKENFRYRFSIS